MQRGTSAGKRALFISSFAPVLENGRALRTYSVIRALVVHGPLDVVYVPFPVEEPSPEFAAIEGVSYHVVRPSRGVRRLGHHARLRATGLPERVARSASPELVDEATRRAAERGRGLIVAGDFSTMAALMPLARRRPLVYNSHNVESSYRPSSDRVGIHHALLRRTERQVLTAAAESWMVSRRDMELAESLAPSARVRYVPNVVDVERIAPVPTRARGRTILMVADFLYGPNVTGAEWLVREVLPRVWSQLPDVRLLMVGRESHRVQGADDPRIKRPGFVADLRGAYLEATTVAVPLVLGGGTPLKFIEALAYGVPVVSTAIAARGLSVQDREHFRQGDDAVSYADALVDLLQHGDAAMAARARALVEREYSLQALVTAITEPATGASS